MIKRAGIALTLLIVLATAISACGSSSSNGSPAVTKAESQVKAVAGTQANTTAKNDVKAEVKPCVDGYTPLQLFHPSTWKKIAGCVKALVPPAKRTQAFNCALKAMATDKIWHKSGRTKFEDSGAAACVVQATNKA